MSDQRAVVEGLAAAAAQGERVVLASVVRTVGSAYRGVGTRMLVRGDDSTAGLVSGGCLEADLVARAKRLRDGAAAEVVTYDTLSADDDLVWGLGLGCNGLVEILLEPLAPPRARAVAALLAGALHGDAPVSIVTVVRAQGAGAPAVGARVRVPRSTGPIDREGDWGEEPLLAQVAADARELADGARRGATRDYSLAGGGMAQLSFEIVVPSVRFVICGSGPDVLPVTRLAVGLGWSVTVVDHRPIALARPDRFPGTHLVECADARGLGDVVSLGCDTAGVVMSHNYERDIDYLDALLASDAGYIGVLGPRSRSERMLADLAARGRAVPDGRGESRLFGPVGLDIGGDGPDVIALAIVAEVSAATSGRRGGHLRERQAPIHGLSGTDLPTLQRPAAKLHAPLL